MQITVLVIVYADAEAISLHESDRQAWSRLVDFVDRTKPQGATETLPGSADNDRNRVDAFFSGENDFYVIANGDTSEIAAYLDRSPMGADFDEGAE